MLRFITFHQIMQTFSHPNVWYVATSYQLILVLSRLFFVFSYAVMIQVSM